MDIQRLYQDYNVDFVTEGHKHSRPGWVNTECPWCTGNPGYHLGFNEDSNYYFCWRCGWHPTASTISKLIKIKEQDARELVRQYGLRLSTIVNEPAIQKPKKDFRFPTNTFPLLTPHQKYLTDRGFNPELLEKIWMLTATGPTSKLDDIDYKNRILIPFVWNHKVVSFDSRSISLKGSHEKRYKACPKDYELIPHKEILYGLQDEWRESGICVEGPTDVWRLGTSSFATSGIQYTPQQVRLIAKIFKKVFILYDPEEQAQVQAHKLVAELEFRGVIAYNIELQTYSDPGSMKQEHADHLVQTLLNI